MIRRMPSGQGPARAASRPGSARPSRPARWAVRAVRRSRAKHPPAKRPPAKRIRAPRTGGLSGRATALTLVLLALAVAYAYPMRVYLSQQAEIDRMVTAQEQQRQRITALTESLSKWEDDDYVIAQARWRLKFVRPGEIAYIVLDDRAPGAAGGADGVKTGPWYRQIWSNIQRADHPLPGDLPE